jgi:hypothetical protein
LGLKDGGRRHARNLCRGTLVLLVAITANFGHSQELAPRAYIITPLHSNAVTLTYSFDNGGLLLDGSAAITGATAQVNVMVLSLFHSLPLAGRTANLMASLPYAVGNFRGTVVGAEANAYRSGLFDAAFRFAINLKGGPAMDAEDFSTWRQKTLIGLSVKVLAPTGQYDPTKLINYGAHRWAIKPELGLSRRWSHWVLDTYGGAWFYTTNHDFFSRNQFSPATNTESQAPIGEFEGHLSYDVKPRLWASLDGNFWFGGRTSLNGVENGNTMQRNSRVGFTLSLPTNRHQSLKFSYSRGAFIRYGGNFNSVSIAWQYAWQGRPN